MKILHVSSARALGGGERHLADLARGLARRGHELYAALRADSPLRAELLASLPAQNIFAHAPAGALDLKSALKLARLARAHDLDIIHAHLARDYTPAALAARMARARLVVTRHVLFPMNRANRLLLSNAARVVAVSGGVARSLRARGIFPADKIRVVHNAIDFERVGAALRDFDREAYRRKLGARARFLVGTVGELSEVKGQDVFIRAAALVAQTQEGAAVEFLVVGEDHARDGHNRARLESLIDELGLGVRVRLLGRTEELSRLLSSLDVFVSASRSEAFGLATVEAMACGAAVVATATEGAREIVEDGATGVLVPVGDSRAMAAAVETLLGDATRRDAVAARAREAARTRFDLARMVEATERVYEEALSEAV